MRNGICPILRPYASWLHQEESYLKNIDMAGLASAWAMARRRRKEYGRKVDAVTRCSGVCPHTLTFVFIYPSEMSEQREMADDNIVKLPVNQFSRINFTTYTCVH